MKRKVSANLSRAIQTAAKEKIKQKKLDRLAREGMKLDPRFEQTMAEEGLSGSMVE